MNLDRLFDKIYAKRRELIKYFIVVFVCSIFRTLATAFFTALGFVGGSGGLVAWAVWTPILFVLLKRVVFKHKSDDVFFLLVQIMKYVMCIFVLWFLNNVFIGFFANFTTNGAVALAVGGMFTELLCIVFMYKIVFRKK